VSAYNLLGRCIYKNHGVKENINYETLREFSESANLWKRRIAIISTYYFIKKGYFDLTTEFATKYIDDNEPLIHKATGWMLREIGKMNEKVLIDFLKKNHKKMPRTMLRYSIERLTKKQKKFFMEK
jgi:3-methyladenine DNA glycosylase AlkD